MSIRDPIRPRTPADRRRVGGALLAAGLCHGLFAVAGALMVVQLWFGMSRTFGAVPAPWSHLVNLALLAQFPLGHSLLLTRRGQRVLAWLWPGEEGRRLATTTYATVASLQLILLFTLWTPTGVVWWQAEGWWLVPFALAYAGAWGVLTKASFDAGPELQAGVVGWWAMLRDRAPRFPDMPERGLFRLVRQPIYVGFALVLWTVPTWTPDQLMLAVPLTLYCLLGPLHKERRFAAIHGARFEAYRRRVPYWLPRLRGGR